MATMKLGRLASSSLRTAKLLQQGGRRTAQKRGCCTVVSQARPELQKARELLPAGIVSAAALTSASGAQAAEAAAAQTPTVDTAVSTLVDVVKAGGEAVKAGLDAAQSGLGYAKQAYDVVAPVLKDAVETAAPVVTSAAKKAVEVAEPAVKTGLQEAGKVLSASGVDTSAVSTSTKVVVETSEQAVTISKPFLEQAITFLTTTDPTLLAEYALGLVAAYYLAPPALKLAAGALRGYAGDVSPAVALAALASSGNNVLLDIRTAREKETSGSPDLPNNGKLVEMEFATIEDRKVRGQLRNANALEVQVTALQIAALKRLSKGTTVFLLDRNGAGAKAVAKALAREGFGRVYVVSGGFQGWVSAKLATKPSTTVSRVEVLAPSSVIYGGTGAARSSPAPVRQLGSGSTRAQTVGSTPARRALPSSTSRA